MREQIQIGSFGLGFKESHNPWSKYRVTYSPNQLLTHLTEVVIPIQLTKIIPGEPPVEVPTIPNPPSFGTMAPDAVALHKYSGNKVDNY